MTSSCDQHCDPALALALVIAEVAVEAWMREQTTANATETVEILGPPFWLVMAIVCMRPQVSEQRSYYNRCI